MRDIGCGVYPALCLLNTSCEQNITKINIGNRVVAMASRPIRYYSSQTNQVGQHQEQMRRHCLQINQISSLFSKKMDQHREQSSRHCYIEVNQILGLSRE